MKNNILSEKEREKLIATLVEELPLLRSTIGLSQDELANVLGVSRQTYSSFETKKRKMSWTIFLSLILFFEQNQKTCELIKEKGLSSRKIFKTKINDDGQKISLFVQMEDDELMNHLDDKAIHAIETVIMIEYARCNDMSGEAVVKTFNAKNIKKISDRDIKAKKAIENIKSKSKK